MPSSCKATIDAFQHEVTFPYIISSNTTSFDLATKWVAASKANSLLSPDKALLLLKTKSNSNNSDTASLAGSATWANSTSAIQD